MTSLLDPIIQSPRLPNYIRKLENVLREEQQKREAFYNTITEDEKAEFVNGEVLMHSPVKLIHNDASSNLAMLLRAFVHKHQLGVVGHEKLMISLTRNDYEPDVCFWKKEKSSQFKPEQLHFPAPDFIAEVLSDSTEKVDRGVKFEDYAAHGVSEYWIIDAGKQTIEQYALDGDQYTLARKLDDGTITSLAIPNFTIPVRALFDSNESARALRDLI